MTSFSSKKRDTKKAKKIYEEEKLSEDRGIYCLMDSCDRVRGGGGVVGQLENRGRSIS